MHNSTGLILAGGAGLRAGGRDKGLIEWQGLPLVTHVVERLRPQVGRLLISCNRNIEVYRTLADATVSDTRAGYEGPLAGIEAAIELMQTEFLIVAPCDNPLLPDNIVQGLLAALDAPSGLVADISYAHDGERGQYLCAALRRRVLDSLPAFLDQGNRAVRQWYSQHRSVAVDFSSQHACFSNINRLE